MIACRWKMVFRWRYVEIEEASWVLNVSPGLINPGWLIVVVPPNSDFDGYWNGGSPKFQQRYKGFIHQGLTFLCSIPSGNLTVRYWKWLIEIVDLPIKIYYPDISRWWFSIVFSKRLPDFFCGASPSDISHRIHGAGIYANMTGVYWWDLCYHI